MSVKSFQQQLDRFSKKLEKRVEAAARGAIVEFGSRVIVRTPVDTGRARGGWQTSIGKAPGGSAPDRTPEAAQQELEATASTLCLGDDVVISNAVEYIGPLEDGSSAQAPNGMIKTTVAEWPEIVRRAVARGRRER